MELLEPASGLCELVLHRLPPLHLARQHRRLGSELSLEFSSNNDIKSRRELLSVVLVVFLRLTKFAELLTAGEDEDGLLEEANVLRASENPVRTCQYGEGGRARRTWL